MYESNYGSERIIKANWRLSWNIKVYWRNGNEWRIKKIYNYFGEKRTMIAHQIYDCYKTEDIT